MRSLLVSALLALLALAPACGGSTGDQVVDFEAVASGPVDAAPGEPLSFDGSHGWRVTPASPRWR